MAIEAFKNSLAVLRVVAQTILSRQDGAARSFFTWESAHRSAKGKTVRQSTTIQQPTTANTTWAG